MSGNYAIGALGGYPSFNALDYQALAAVMNTPNPNAQVAFRGNAQSVQPTAVASTPQVQYVQAEPEKKGKRGKVVLGTILVAGAAACIYGFKKGNVDLKGFARVKDGLKTAWSSIRGKAGKVAADVTEKTGAVLPKAGNVQEVTVMKDGMQFVMKDGKPVKIVTRESKIIDKPEAIAKWVSSNKTTVDAIKKLDVSSVLPKGVSLSYTKEIVDGKKTYQMIVENGKIVKILSKDSNGKFAEIAQKDFEAFIKNHPGVVNKATTLTSTLNNQTVKLLDKNGKLVARSGQNVKISVKDGKVLEATIGGRKLKEEELKALQKDLSKEISQFGKQSGNKYEGLKEFEYVYRQKGGQEVRFNASHNITSVNSARENVIMSSEGIRKYLEANSGIKAELDGLTVGSTLPNGYRLGNITLKSDSGNIFTVCGGKVTSIKLADGKVLSSKNEIANWRKAAANNNEFEGILQSLKS